MTPILHSPPVRLRIALLAALSLPAASCGQARLATAPALPPTDVSRNSTTLSAQQAATYDGPGKLEARVYQLTSAAVALDLVQRWRPSADTVFFHQGRYFVVVKWQEAERKALQAFVHELEGRLSSKS